MTMLTVVCQAMCMLLKNHSGGYLNPLLSPVMISQIFDQAEDFNVDGQLLSVFISFNLCVLLWVDAEETPLWTQIRLN